MRRASVRVVSLPPETGYKHPSGHSHHLGGPPSERVARALRLLAAVEAIEEAARLGPVAIEPDGEGWWHADAEPAPGCICRTLEGVLVMLGEEVA